ncbi:MAG: AraC family transcriptional regulator [Myxococcales bacterium]
MSGPEVESHHSYSVRLVKPFIRLLSSYEQVPPELLTWTDDADPDARLPASTIHELLRGALVLTGDEDLGLKAARTIEPGDYGALEYAATSAGTMRESIDVISRYMRLINDALDFSLEVLEGIAHVRLESAVVVPRAAEDFAVAAFHVATGYRMDFDESGRDTPELEVWFTHPEPADVSEYAETFPRASRIRFDQPHAGFAFPEAMLDRELPSADPKLHEVLRRHADQLLAELPQAQSCTERVRALLMDELRGGNPTAVHISSALHMSSRTLTRKLEQEGTSFKEVLDDLRRRLALRYVGGTDLGIAEIAFLLGFSQAAAFHRAFRRWADQTPLEYRRARRG